MLSLDAPKILTINGVSRDAKPTLLQSIEFKYIFFVFSGAVTALQEVNSVGMQFEFSVCMAYHMT